MCLDLKKDSKELIAESDISCYKVLLNRDGGFITMFKYSPVEIGSTYQSKLEIDDSYNNYPNIQIGLHSLKTVKNCLEMIYSYRCCYERCAIDTAYIVKCIIPKDSKYFEGNFEGLSGYASSTIKYLEVVDEIVIQNLENLTKCV